MKRICFLIIVAVVSVSCSDDEPTDAQVKVAVENNVKIGTWRITNFMDSGVDHTSSFTGFSFTFSEDGSITAVKGGTSYTGTWSISDSNSSDDSPDDLDFNIHFNLTNDFEDLNEDWDIVTQSPLKIVLIHVSGGGGGTDNLTFERN